MKHLTWFLLRHGWLPGVPWLRRRLLRSVFRPAHPRDFDGGPTGWYDIGANATPEQAERFKSWVNDNE